MENSAYAGFLGAHVLSELIRQSRPVCGIQGLSQIGELGGLESQESFEFLVKIYKELKAPLERVLVQRKKDREFIDQRVGACYRLNHRLRTDFLDQTYQTILGEQDESLRVVVGPNPGSRYLKSEPRAVAPLPEFLKGPHITLFGPPDDAKLSINAMNAIHRKIKDEPAIISKLIESSAIAPMWGADDEDSKTPLREDLVNAGINLSGCLDRSLSYHEYRLAADKLSKPIKRFPGLALPTTFLFFEGEPLPLHLYDFALHLFRHWNNPQALCFYVPKLENEEEAAYIHLMIQTAETVLQKLHPSYQAGTVRVLIVLENPRAIFRAQEMMDALYPYFAGASLGWHDYLASTARLFKEDGNYRIPVKADPHIVIKYIKASHELLARNLGPSGAIKIGGMYGVLPVDGDLNSSSFQVTIKGFIKDVITQLKRDLTGFWVAHPDFVRIGIALVEAWKLRQSGDDEALRSLVCGLVLERDQREILEFINGPDVEGLDLEDPLYPRSLLVADMKESNFIANNHPDEIRYNVFQSLQYLTDWLCGNGCVALPSHIDGVPIRVMDDLATAERSRWEVWHEIYHGRFKVEELVQIAFEELRDIRKNVSTPEKNIQIKWDQRTAKWYPVALHIMLKLMTDTRPVEFATELLLPFTHGAFRESQTPLKALLELDYQKYALEIRVERLAAAFEACGHLDFAHAMASCPYFNEDLAWKVISDFSLKDVVEAASFHGDIGQSKLALDENAAKEQAEAHLSDQTTLNELRILGQAYLEKFGFKFLVSAQGKSAKALLAELRARLDQPRELELGLAKQALFEIAKKRMAHLQAPFTSLLEKHGINSVQVSIASGDEFRESGHETYSCGQTTTETYFEIASLSKTIASALAIEFFKEEGISLDASVDGLLKKSGSSFTLGDDRVLVKHLMNHTALNQHYVRGIPITSAMPTCADLLNGSEVYGYRKTSVLAKNPGERFHYSGGGFLVLEHLIEALSGKSIEAWAVPRLKALGWDGIQCHPKNMASRKYASGVAPDGKPIPGGRLMFPCFAAGMLAPSKEVLKVLESLSAAFNDPEAGPPLSHDTAVRMLKGVDGFRDKGSHAFMGVDLGLGVFTAEAGPNRMMIHQGANDGFRSLYVFCFEGPDKGKGFVIFCNANDEGIPFIADVCRELFIKLRIQGVEGVVKALNTPINTHNYIIPEERVNQGYKEMIFDSFIKDLPERIVRSNPVLAPHAQLNLAVDATILSVTNEKFARAENCISPYLPEFDPCLYGRQGKVMDSWESSRHNSKYDELMLRLKVPSKIVHVLLSTEFHLGNQAPFVEIDGIPLGSLDRKWKPIVAQLALEGHAQTYAKSLDSETSFEVIRIKMIPDGGLSRVGLFDDRLPLGDRMSFRYQHEIPKPKKPLVLKYRPQDIRVLRDRFKRGELVDVASQAFGGAVLSVTNEHFGEASQVISPVEPLHMFDGFESARSRVPGHFEELELKLGQESVIDHIKFELNYFLNNAPVDLSVAVDHNGKWEPLLGPIRVKEYAGNIALFKNGRDFKHNAFVKKLKVIVYPDGGINRIRVLAPLN